MQSKPKFLVVVWVPTFDNRDVIVGSRGHVVGTAETLRWADVLVSRQWEELEGSELYAEVRLNDAHWSRPVRLSPEAVEVAFEQDGDIPF